MYEAVACLRTDDIAPVGIGDKKKEDVRMRPWASLIHAMSPTRKTEYPAA